MSTSAVFATSPQAEKLWQGFVNQSGKDLMPLTTFWAICEAGEWGTCEVALSVLNMFASQVESLFCFTCISYFLFPRLVLMHDMTDNSSAFAVAPVLCALQRLVYFGKGYVLSAFLVDRGLYRMYTYDSYI